MTEDNMDLPAFLRLDAARRRAAWEHFRPVVRNAVHEPEAPPKWDDPGSVARGLGYPESDAEREARMFYHAARRQERERKAVIIEKRQEQADDESIQRALMEHKRELRQKELKKGRVQKVTRKF